MEQVTQEIKKEYVAASRYSGYAPTDFEKSTGIFNFEKDRCWVYDYNQDTSISSDRPSAETALVES